MSLGVDGQDPTAGWRLWESTPGYGERRRYYATRLPAWMEKPLTEEQLGRDIAMTIFAETAEERLRKLHQQNAMLQPVEPQAEATQ